MFSTHQCETLFANRPTEGENTYLISQSIARRAIDFYPRNFLKFAFSCLIIFLVFVPPCLCESPSSSKSNSDFSRLLDFQEKLESRIFSEKDLKNCKKLLKKTKDEGLRRNLSIVLSRYERELNDKPQESLNFIAPEVLPPEKLAEFQKKFPADSNKEKQIKSGAPACQCPINILTNPSMTIPVSPVSPATDVL